MTVAPKGVYTTSTKTFRVQLNLSEHDHKFSRNVETLEDAIWLYEIKILSSDQPKSIEPLKRAGNYDSLISLKVIESNYDYYEKLGFKIKELCDLRCVTKTEFEIANKV